MKTLLKLGEMLQYLPDKVKDAVHHVAKDAGRKTDDLELHRHSHSEKAKVNEIDPTSRKSLAYVSHRSQDRDDEIVIPKALRLDEFRKYMSVLVNHNYSLLPVGSDEWIDADDYGVKALTVHADTGTGTLANVVWDLTRQGHLKGRSVGFVPLSFTKPGARDWDHVANGLQSDWKEFDKARAEKSVSRIITDGVLLEHSFVSVPCNVDAEFIGVVKALNVEDKVIKQLGWEMKDGILVSKAEQKPEKCVCDECGFVSDAVPGSKCPECKTGDMKPKGKEKAIEVRVVGKGGPGSGNFGHSGRPGELGGSGSGGGRNAESNKLVAASERSSGDAWAKTTLANSPKTHEEAATAHDQAAAKARAILKKPPKDLAEFPDEGITLSHYESIAHSHETQANLHRIRAKEPAPTEEQRRAAQDFFGKSFHSHAVEKPNSHMPGGSFSACVLLMEDKGHSTESAKKICGALQAESGEKLYDIIAEEVVKKGGQGSGNFGHEGRPGERGGSGPAGADVPDKIANAVDPMNQVRHYLSQQTGTSVSTITRNRIQDRISETRTNLQRISSPEASNRISLLDKIDALVAEGDLEKATRYVNRVLSDVNKSFHSEIKIIRPAPQIKVLYVPPDPVLIAKGVGDAVEKALARKTGKIL